MKSLLATALFASAGAVMLASSSMAATSLGAGSLAIAFYQTNAAGTVVQPNTYVYNLGAASLYRDATTAGTVSVSTINSGLNANIGADLETAFGPNWQDSGTVRWTIVGGINAGAGTVNGDIARTTYVSRSNTTFLTDVAGAGSTIPNTSSTNRGALALDINAFFNATNGAVKLTGTTNSEGVMIASELANTIENYFVGGLSFNAPGDTRQLLASGDINGVEGALDLYRIENVNPGTGEFIGTFTLDDAGNLSFTNAVPEPSSAMLVGAAGVISLLRRKRSAKTLA